MKQIRLPVLVVLLICICVLGALVLNAELRKQELKEDLIELCDIKYGLFNVEAWKQMISQIVSKRIHEFELKGKTSDEVRKEISAFLTEAINDFEARYKSGENKGVKGFLQESVASITGIFDKLREDVPVFTSEIMAFMADPKTKDAITSYVDTTLNRYTQRAPATDSSAYFRVMEKYHIQSEEEAFSTLQNRIDAVSRQSRPLQYLLFAAVIFMICSVVFLKKLTRREYLIATITCFPILATGLLLPMIEIDARVADMQFQLLGERVAFDNQVIYFRSKSILEVVELMITDEKVELIFVGFLVLLFSVLFPVSKLISSLVYLYHTGARENRIVKFLVFRTAKWSMADVLVVAIFMAYIGFTSMIGDQLSKIENIQSIDALTTNASQLLTGYYVFIAFVLLSLFISHQLQYKFRGTPPASG